MMPGDQTQEEGERTERSHSDRSDRSDRRQGGRRGQALTVVVDDRGIEAALRVFKRLVLKEGLLKDIKRHMYFEKPGDRKRRKTREAIRRRRRQAARSRDRFGGGDRE
jgi:small subunit ribosomal protein S21